MFRFKGLDEENEYILHVTRMCVVSAWYIIEGYIFQRGPPKNLSLSTHNSHNVTHTPPIRVMRESFPLNSRIMTTAELMLCDI